MRNNKKALILSGIKWNTTIQRHHAVARSLSEMGYEVYFVEGIVSSSFSLGKLLKKITGRLKGGVDTQSNVPKNDVYVVSGGFVNPHGGLFAYYNKRCVDGLLRHIPDEYELVVSYLPVKTTLHILDRVKTSRYIYDCVRDFTNWGGYPKDIRSIEKRLVELSESVLVDSYYLRDKMHKKYPEKNIQQILPMLKDGQAEVFEKGKPPLGIKKITYIGQISSHINIDIFDTLIEGDYEIHHFGDSTISLSPAIVSHGFTADPVELAQLILDNSDALIIPYKGNMDGVIPAKLFECLATNLPVFVNSFYDSRELADMLYVYNDAEDLMRQLDCFDIGDHAKRLEVTREYLGMHGMLAEKDRLRSTLRGNNK